ncbi:hypothetical protein GCM10027082_44130 [Comamonas humi]
MALRAQYHFRPGPQGLQAWDVRRLVALAAPLAPRWVPLSAIAELDEPYWFSEHDPHPTTRALAEHMRLVQQADTAYPIVLCAEGRVMDGMHRVVRRLLDGHDTVLAVQFAATPPPDHLDADPDALPYDDQDD